MQTLYRGKNPNSKLNIITLEKIALKIMNNPPRYSHSNPLFKKSNILNFEDKVVISNIIVINQSINNLLPPVFQNYFILSP